MADIIDPLGDFEEESQRSSDPRTMCHFDFSSEHWPTADNFHYLRLLTFLLFTMAGVIDALGGLEEESQLSSDTTIMCHFDSISPKDTASQLMTSIT